MVYGVGNNLGSLRNPLGFCFIFLKWGLFPGHTIFVHFCVFIFLDLHPRLDCTAKGKIQTDPLVLMTMRKFTQNRNIYVCDTSLLNFFWCCYSPLMHLYWHVI